MRNNCVRHTVDLSDAQTPLRVLYTTCSLQIQRHLPPGKQKHRLNITLRRALQLAAATNPSTHIHTVTYRYIPIYWAAVIEKLPSPRKPPCYPPSTRRLEACKPTRHQGQHRPAYHRRKRDTDASP